METMGKRRESQQPDYLWTRHPSFGRHGLKGIVYVALNEKITAHLLIQSR